jgi:hypothetical protein
MTRSLYIFIALLFAVSVDAQEHGYLEFVKAENRLQDLFNRFYTGQSAETEPLLDTIREEMAEALSLPGSMDYPWRKLDKIGIITSEDDILRVFTWHVEDDVDHYRYFGFMQVRLKKGKSKLFELHDNGKPQRGTGKADQTTEDWFGKLYYQIHTNRYKRETYYTLMGMDFNNSRSIIKSVEVMTIQRNNPRFVRSCIAMGPDFQDRLLLEYSSQVSISVRYDPRTDMITFDHLVPMHPIYENDFEFYNPDGSFDGLEFSRGTWIYQEDIDARNID